MGYLRYWKKVCSQKWHYVGNDKQTGQAPCWRWIVPERSYFESGKADSYHFFINDTYICSSSAVGAHVGSKVHWYQMIVIFKCIMTLMIKVTTSKTGRLGVNQKAYLYSKIFANMSIWVYLKNNCSFQIYHYLIWWLCSTVEIIKIILLI